MLNLSLMPLDTDHFEEICEDIRNQQESGASNCAMMMMYFSPCGTPPVDRAEFYCRKYDRFAERFEKEGIRHGVAVQSTVGHVAPPDQPNPFDKVVGLRDGIVREGVCCPLDENFREYIRRQMSILASHKPGYVLIDDDVGLLYREFKGCACPRHIALFNSLAHTDWDREELKKHVLSDDPADEKYKEIYIETQRIGLVGAVKKMREGIDSADPSVQGIVCTAANYCEFTEELADAFAGEGNPRIARFNNGNYTASGARWLSRAMLRAASQREIMKDKVDIFLAETDCCPHNRYSVSASGLHAHFAATILEGAKGAKHWITRLHVYEPASGKAYRKVLAKYSGFYEKLAELSDQLKPFGCHIPLSRRKDYHLADRDVVNVVLSGWACCFLERMGFPMYFAGGQGGAVFFDDDTPEKFTDEEVKEYLKGTLILTAEAAEKLNRRGFSDYIGTDVREWEGASVTGEVLDAGKGHVSGMCRLKELVPNQKETAVLSEAVNNKEGEDIPLFAASVSFRNKEGGQVFVFSGSADTKYNYLEAFSLLNESRKKQFIRLLRDTGNLPVYYPEDAEIYLRAGYLPNGEMLCAFFNIGLDNLDEIPLVFEKKPVSIEMLMPDGSRKPCEFYEENGITRIRERAEIQYPVILFIC